MVTSKQFVRGVGRTMRAMDRAGKQAERERVARQQALHREAHLDASARAAAEYDEIMAALTGAHRGPFEPMDWLETANAPEVQAPDRGSSAEDSAAAKLANYSAGWLVRALGREWKERDRLVEDIAAARTKDAAVHSAAVAAAKALNDEIAIARRVIDRDPDAMVTALDNYSQLGDLPFSVEGLDTLFMDGRTIAIVDGLDLEDMPEETVTLLRSGKASVKDLPVGKRLDVHREAICSAAIRVAMEFLMVLPIDEVEVLMLTDILDRGTGHIHSAPVLHLRATSQALAALNLPRTQAAAVAERLGAHMDWSKRDGFREINAAALGIDVPARVTGQLD